ncbi:hypothetical protein Tco_1536494, partial [Tanacetum coccineum]
DAFHQRGVLQVYSPPKNDLSWTGLPEFVDDTVTDYSRPTPSVDVSKDVSASFLEQRGSVGNVLSKLMISFVKETGCPSVSKVNNTEKSRKPTMNFEHLKFDCKQNTWVNKGKTWRRVDHDHDNMKYLSIPTLDSAHPKLTSFVKTAHSHVKRPFVRKITVINKVWIPTARTKFPTVGSKVPTAKPTAAAVKGNRGKAVKASACWI